MALSLELSKELWNQVQSNPVELERCEDILERLVAINIILPPPHTAQHNHKKLTATLTAAQRCFRVQKRRVTNTEKSKRWQALLQQTQDVLDRIKDTQKQPVDRGKATHEQEEADQETGLPASTDVYLARLRKQGKDLYKNPPKMPPGAVTIHPDRCPLPTQNPTTGALTFAAAPKEEDDDSLELLLKDFHPNQTPEQVLRGGAFGGTYFRPIVSAVTNQRYTNALESTVPPKWIQGLGKSVMLTSSTYRREVNKFKVKCGGSLGMWEVCVRAH